MTICGCRSPLCSMITQRSAPPGSRSLRSVSPSTISSKRILPATSAGLADRLGGDDTHGHTFLDQVAGGQVHAVAEAADAQGRLAGHRAADENLVDAEQLDLAGLLPGDHLVFLDDHFAGDGRDGVAAD